MPVRNLLLYAAASGLALLISVWAILFAYVGLLLALDVDVRSEALAVVATMLISVASFGTLVGIVAAAGRALRIRRVVVFATVFFLTGAAGVPYAYYLSVINACTTNTSFPITGLDACSR